MKTVTFKVVGDHTMHCGGCENAIKFALQQLPRVQDVQASRKTQLVMIQFDDAQDCTLEQIAKGLNNLGYQIDEIQL